MGGSDDWTRTFFVIYIDQEIVSGPYTQAPEWLDKLNVKHTVTNLADNL